MIEIIFLGLVAFAAAYKWRPLLLAVIFPVFLAVNILGNMRNRMQNIGSRGNGSDHRSNVKAASGNTHYGEYADFQRTSFITVDILAASFTDTTGQISAPDGHPWLVGVNLENNDLDATTTDDGGIESYRVMTSDQIHVLAGPFAYGISTARIQTDVSAIQAGQPAIRYALVNMNVGNSEIVIEARSAVADTDGITNLLWADGPINGYGKIDSSQDGLLAHSFVVTANIGTAFEDLFAAGDISPPPGFDWLAGVMLRNGEIADTLGLSRWQQLASDQTTVLHGPTSEGIHSSAQQGDVSLVLQTTFGAMPAIVNNKAPAKFNIQGISTVETDAICNVVYAKRKIGIADLMYPVGAT